MRPVVIKEYKNCTEVHEHGVGRKGAADHVSGTTDPVTTFLRHTALYDANRKSDRDKDGIACEQL